MGISVGQPAPAFKLFDDSRKPVELADYRGKNVLLLFFPGAFTSVCTTELNDVNNDLEYYAGRNTEVLGISTDSPFALAEFKKVHRFGYRLLSDHDAAVCERYGAKYDHDFTPMQLDRIAKRAAFLIDGEGIVRYAEVLDNAGEVPDFDAIRQSLAQMAEAQA